MWKEKAQVLYVLLIAYQIGSEIWMIIFSGTIVIEGWEWPFLWINLQLRFIIPTETPFFTSLFFLSHVKKKSFLLTYWIIWKRLWLIQSHFSCWRSSLTIHSTSKTSRSNVGLFETMRFRPKEANNTFSGESSRMLWSRWMRTSVQEWYLK